MRGDERAAENAMEEGGRNAVAFTESVGIASRFIDLKFRRTPSWRRRLLKKRLAAADIA